MVNPCLAVQGSADQFQRTRLLEFWIFLAAVKPININAPTRGAPPPRASVHRCDDAHGPTHPKYWLRIGTRHLHVHLMLRPRACPVLSLRSAAVLPLPRASSRERCGRAAASSAAYLRSRWMARCSLLAPWITRSSGGCSYALGSHAELGGAASRRRLPALCFASRPPTGGTHGERAARKTMGVLRDVAARPTAIHRGGCRTACDQNSEGSPAVYRHRRGCCPRSRQSRLRLQ
eukprot:7381778-Prymnesium_polylepis.1